MPFLSAGWFAPWGERRNIAPAQTTANDWPSAPASRQGGLHPGAKEKYRPGANHG